LTFLAKIHQHNETTQDSMRKFDIRIGINENVDNIITDINGRQNVAGAGINMAQRVMSCADARQLLVGQMVFETFANRERYMHAFRSYHAHIKHGLVIPVHQFIEEGHDGLSHEVPNAFAPAIQKERRFTELEAYYIGFAIKHREFLCNNIKPGLSADTLTLLLWFLAEDAVEIKHATDYNPATVKVFAEGKASLRESFDHYMSIDPWVCIEMVHFIKEQLSELAPYLEDTVSTYFVVTEEGKKKLRQDHPDIFNSLDLEATSNNSS
ncbi:hypothetical protein KKB28_09845, partial [bacterium]|nr:hypothetical protein [bacterium]